MMRLHDMMRALIYGLPTYGYLAAACRMQFWQFFQPALRSTCTI
jgi:hypothetical protein